MWSHALAAYLPLDRCHALAAGRDLPERSTGAALLADLSGFTPLTEALTRELGPRRGVEELARQINQLYDALLAPVHAYGGSVIGFAGDAMTCYFDQDQGLSATACALAMQEEMQAFREVLLPTGQSVTLTLKVGIATGPVRRFLVGDPQIQVLEVLAGETLVRMAEAEHGAERGEVVLDGITAHALGEALQVSRWCQATPGGARMAVVSALRQPVAASGWPERVMSALPAERLRPWLLPIVYEQLRAGQGEFLTELRPAVACFVRFGGINYDQDEAAGKKLEQFIRWVQQVTVAHEGTLMDLTIGDKGSYLYLVFGAPVGHENDALRAVQVAHTLLSLPPELAFLDPPQIGISQGLMRAGVYGGTTRRAYGALGDEVNLAARLMQAAPPGQVLVSGRVCAATGDAFTWEAQPALSVKGRSEPVPVLILGGRATQPAVLETALPESTLVGRQAELTRLRAYLQPLVEGSFIGLLYIYGEAGMGKSRLVAELRERLKRHYPWRWFTCPAESILRASLHPFKYFLRSYFGQDSERPPAENQARFDALLEANLADLGARGAGMLREGLARARPFLAALVELHWEDSPYERMEPRLRFENSLAALKTLLLAESLRQPVVLHIEDAHWLDADSQEALRVLTHNIARYPLAVLLTSRYRDDGSPFTLEVAPGVVQQAVTLPELGASGVKRLATTVLGRAPTDALTLFLAEKSNGNPFFVEQLLLDLRERGSLVQEPGEQWTLRDQQAVEVPQGINAVLVARLDRLESPVKTVVQTAAALGQEFEVRVLFAMLEEDMDLPRKVRLAEQETIWSASGEASYRFRHALLRDAAYTMQPQARLRVLHLSAGRALERLALTQGDGPAHYADLVYHFRQAEDSARERHYARLAGEEAAARFANADALAYLSRALALTPEEHIAERYTLLSAREELYDRLGARAEQAQELASLAALAPQLEEAEQAQVALRQVQYAQVTGDYPQAIAAAQRAVRLAQRAGVVASEATGYLRWGWVLYCQVDYPAALAQLEQALALARTARLPQIEAECLRQIAVIVHRNQSDNRQMQEMLERALSLYHEAGDRQGEMLVLDSLGDLAFHHERYGEARAYYEQVLRFCREIGSRHRESFALFSLAVTHWSQGHALAGRSCYEQCLELSREIGNRRGESWALDGLGDVALQLGAYAEAEAYYERALALCRELGDRWSECQILAVQGLLAHLLGEHERACERSQEALHVAQDIDSRPDQSLALTCLGHALVGQGRLREAADAYQEALLLRQELGQQTRAMEPLAGLAEVALAEGNLSEAIRRVEEILAHLAHNTLEGTVEPFRVYLICYRVLLAKTPSQAAEVLRVAYDALLAQASQIDDATVRRAFLEQVPVHRELVRAFEQGK